MGAAFAFLWVTGTSLLLFRPRAQTVSTPETKRIKYTDDKIKAPDGTTIKYWLLKGFLGSGDAAQAIAAGKDPNSGNSRREAWQDRPMVILLHGIGMERSRYLEEAQFILEEGYACVIPDMRCHGLSGGYITTLGAVERADTVALMKHLQKSYGIEKFILWGFSLGGTTSILAAADSNLVSAVIADSPFDTYSSVALTTARHWFGPVPAFIIDLCVSTAGVLGGFDPESVNCIKAAAKLGDRPTLLIVGEKDPRAPEWMADNIIRGAEGASSNEDESSETDISKWVVPEAQHVEAWSTDKDTYKEKILEILNRL